MMSTQFLKSQIINKVENIPSEKIQQKIKFINLKWDFVGVNTIKLLNTNLSTSYK